MVVGDGVVVVGVVGKEEEEEEEEEKNTTVHRCTIAREIVRAILSKN